MLAWPVDLENASRFDPKDDGFIVTFPDIPEAITQGDTKEEALHNAAEALELALAFYVDENRDLPKTSPRRGRPLVSPSLIATMKLELYQTMREHKIRKSALARRLGCHRPQIDRMLDLAHDSRVDQIEAAFAALGQRVEVAVAAM